MKDDDWLDAILEKRGMSFIDGDYRDYHMKEQYDPRMRYAELEHMQKLADNPPH